MDFDLPDDLAAVRELSAQIFEDRATLERVRAVETDSHGHDAELWKILAEAGLLGISLPEEAGGAGLGVLGMATVLEQQGRRVAPIPLWAVLSTAALPIARFGSPEQRERWLPGVADGGTIVTGDFELRADGSPAVLALAAGDGWRISGELTGVAGAGVADAVVLPFRLDSGGCAVAVVPTDRPGLTVTPQESTNRGETGAVTLENVPLAAADLLSGDGDEIIEWVLARARVALAALQLGVCEEAVRITAAYTSQRHQFGRPLSTNQAVTLRAADAYLDTECIRLTTQRAAWLLDQGEEHDGRIAALVAKSWAARGGLRVVHATQHLHGGIGADVEYPIHRYFLFGRQAAITLGGAAATEACLGGLLEQAPRIGAPA